MACAINRSRTSLLLSTVEHWTSILSTWTVDVKYPDRIEVKSPQQQIDIKYISADSELNRSSSMVTHPTMQNGSSPASAPAGKKTPFFLLQPPPRILHQQPRLFLWMMVCLILCSRKNLLGSASHRQILEESTWINVLHDGSRLHDEAIQFVHTDNPKKIRKKSR